MNRAIVSLGLLGLSLLVLLPLSLVHGIQPNIPTSTVYDTTLENGKGGNALLVQDRHVYIKAAEPLVSTVSHPNGFNSFSISLYYRQTIQGIMSQLMQYEVPPDHMEAFAPISIYGLSTLSLQYDISDQFNINTPLKAFFDGSWHHTVITWTGVTGITEVYFDGVLSFSRNVSFGKVIPSGGYLSLGQTRYFQPTFGTLDEFLFYTSVLSTSDRQAITALTADSPLNTILSGSLMPDVYWSFNQPISTGLNGLGQIILDDSGNGNHALVYSADLITFPIIVPSTVKAWTSPSNTILFPVTGTSTDYTLQLALSGSTIHSNYTATSVTITSLPDPTLVVLYHVDALGVVGAPVNVNDQIIGSTASAATVITVVARASSTFILTSTTGFDYTIAPMNASLPASIATHVTIGANNPPLAGPPDHFLIGNNMVLRPNDDAFTSVIDIQELKVLTFLPLWQLFPSVREYFCHDINGDSLQAYLVSVPLGGKLYPTIADQKAGTNQITSASYASPVLVTHQTLVYLAPLKDGTVQNVSIIISDGREWSANPRIVQFNILSLPHQPKPQPFEFSADQDSMQLIQLPIDVSGLDYEDVPYITITSLPTAGDLYQINPEDGSLGSRIGDIGLESAQISQWLSSIQAASSWYHDPLGTNHWSPQQILGPPDFFPNYGGSPLVWAGLNPNEAEWVEASFDTPVYITQIEIFETFNPGHIAAIYGKHPSSTVNNTKWVMIWHNDNLAPPVPTINGKSNILSPSLCPMAFATRSIRIEVASTGNNWAEFDAVRVVGNAVRARSMDVLDLTGRLYYKAPHLTRGMDQFSYIANSCRYYGQFRSLNIQQNVVNTTLIPVNHPPIVSALAVTTDPYGVGSFASLSGTDPDGDAITYQIVTLPANGDLWINTQGGSPSDSKTATLVTPAQLPLTIPPVTTFRYEATSNCPYSDTQAFLTDSFQYTATDVNSIPPSMTSTPVSVSVSQYCIRPEAVSSSVNNLIIFFVVIGITSCVAIMCGFIYFRDQQVIKASSIVFNMISLVGCIGLFVSLIPLIQTNLNNHWCFARWAVPCLSFTLVFSSLFAKTFRIYKIFMNKQFSQPVLGNTDLMKFVISGVGFISIILLVYGIVNKPQPMYDYKLDDTHTVYGGCTTSNVFRGLLLASQGALIIAGTYLTVLVRNVPSLFNEGSYIGITIYNALVLGVLGIILDFVLVDNPHGQTVVRCFLLIVGTFVVIGALYCTKIFQVYKVWHQARASRLSSEDIRRRLEKRFLKQALKEGKGQDAAEQWAKEEVLKRLGPVTAREQQPIMGGNTILSGTDESRLSSNLGLGGPGVTRLDTSMTPGAPMKVIPRASALSVSASTRNGSHGQPAPFPQMKVSKGAAAAGASPTMTKSTLAGNVEGTMNMNFTPQSKVVRLHTESGAEEGTSTKPTETMLVSPSASADQSHALAEPITPLPTESTPQDAVHAEQVTIDMPPGQQS